MGREFEELRRMVAELGARLERVEGRLGIDERAGAASSPAIAAPPTAPPLAPPIMAAHTSPEAAAERPVAEFPASRLDEAPTRGAPTDLDELRRRRHSAHGRTPEGGAPALAPPMAPPTAPGPVTHTEPPVFEPPPYAPPLAPPMRTAASDERRGAGAAGGKDHTLEWLLGGRLYAAAGALVFIIGVAMGLKYGLDKGWFRFPPELRCVMCAVVGAAMIGGGEVVRRKLGRSGAIAAAALGAAGLAVVYAAAYASYGLYHLVPMTVAFVLLAVVSAGGIALALMTGSLVMGALALVGAYLNPLLMGQQGPSPWIGPAYLTALLVLGLALAGWRPDPFRWLRTVASWGTVVVGTIVLAGVAREHAPLAMAFVAVWWALVHAELVLGARRLAESAETPGAVVLADAAAWRVTRPSLSSLGMTLWSVGAGLAALEISKVPVTGFERWMITGGWTVATAALALVLAGNLRVMRDAPATDAERLGVTLWAEAAALLVATVALGLSDWAQSVAWIAMGLAVVAAGRWSRAKLLDAYGVVLLAIAAGRLVLWDSWHVGGAGGGRIVLGVMVDRWTLFMLAGGAAWLGAAWLLQRSDAVGEEGEPAVGGGGESPVRAGAVSVALGVGLSLACAAVVRPSTAPAALVLAPAALCALVSASALWRRSAGLGVYAVVALLGSALTWGGMYAADAWGGPTLAGARGFGGGGAAPFMHPALWSALGAAALGCVAAMAYRKPPGWRTTAWMLGAALLWTGGALALASSSLEIARSASLLASDRAVRGAAVSGWWGVLGVGLVLAGFVAAWPSMRWVGLALLGAAAVKAVLLDLADVSQGWRIVSFIGLGALMLGVAVGYAQVSKRLSVQGTT